MASKDGDVQIVPDSQFVLSCENELTGHSIRVFICPIVMALAFPILQKPLRKYMAANSYNENIQESSRSSRLLPYPSEFVELRAKLQSLPGCVEQLELSGVTNQPAVWINLCWALHRKLLPREDISPAMISDILDTFDRGEMSAPAIATVCDEVDWFLRRDVNAALCQPYSDAKAKHLLHLASRLCENGADLEYLSEDCIRPILRMMPSTASRASLLSRQIFTIDCDALLTRRASVMDKIASAIKEKVQSATKTTSICVNGCSYVSGIGSAFVRHLNTIKLWPVEELEQLPPQEIVAKLQKFSLEHLRHLKACAGLKRADCKAMQMTSPSKLIQEMRSLARSIDDQCLLPCLACLCGVKIRPHKCWDEEGKAIEL